MELYSVVLCLFWGVWGCPFITRVEDKVQQARSIDDWWNYIMHKHPPHIFTDYCTTLVENYRTYFQDLCIRTKKVYDDEMIQYCSWLFCIIAISPQHVMYFSVIISINVLWYYSWHVQLQFCIRTPTDRREGGRIFFGIMACAFITCRHAHGHAVCTATNREQTEYRRGTGLPSVGAPPPWLVVWSGQAT